MKRIALLLLAGAIVATDAPPYRNSPERRTVVETRDWGEWAGPFRAKLVPSMMQDFGERYIYAPANAALPPPVKGVQRVVFLGDSITDQWNLARDFPGMPYVNRGISAQVTAQMLVRFEQDVVALQPTAVVILAGTNDVTGFLQIETPETIIANISAMADIADARGIRVVIGALLPVNDYNENARYVVKERPPATLRAINAGLRGLARRRGYAFADYEMALVDAHGLLCAACSGDGLHPNDTGYARMRPIVSAAIAQAINALHHPAKLRGRPDR
ncbi:GDSL family lipase [Sphingobium sp. AS12]|uniref:GDSL-type esterase/lipase family protein n=1 Tax=Sphingobium sp. AS12 TaxID=2849495 RepID=UPI001C314967|nr:GDSL-type esterase/lipase family protein [Sphingobium sp. AS12]MBV2148149.1 GDSL family lipase [Sphingobium sp. AS12]